jgi:hypothetical protein
MATLDLGPGYLGGRQYALALALTAAIVVAVVATHAPPAVRGPQTPAAEFSAARAFGDVVALTSFGPRPSPAVGAPPAPAHELARAWVEQRLRELGLQPITEDGTACTARGTCGPVRNVIARLDPGGAAAAEPAVMLLAHYDSVAAGPGAGDDAAGVASILEIVRALRTTATIKRPLVVVIDDGEERGLLGARVLCQGPWARRVAAVLNFEARGNAGQTAMFETSDKSAWLVDLYGKAVARPVASSLIYSLYRALPNDTDLTITKGAGLRGLNFAFADHEWDYHTPRDSAENLDPRSLQHMGDQGLAVTRALLERAELPTVDDDAVWFDLFTLRLVVYRALWAKALAVLQALLVAAAAIVLLRGARGHGRAMAWGAARVVGTLGLALLAGFLVSKLVVALTGQPRPWRSRPLPTFLALVFFTAAVGCAGQQLLDRLWPARRLLAVYAAAVGGLLLWTAPSLLLAFAVPGASYVFTLPALGGSVALLLAAWRTDPAESATRPATPAGASFALAVVLATAVPGLLLWLPILRVLLVMIGANLHPAVTLPMGLLLTLVEPMHRLFPSRLRALLPAGSLVLALACVGWAAR